MAYLNRATLIGNIGKEPEIKTLQNSRKFVSFSLATSKRYRDNNGEQKEDTQWHNIVIWGKNAETFENLGIGKGTQLYIEGEITNRSWTDQTTGQKRYSTEVVAFTFHLVGPRQQQGQYVPQSAPYDYSQGGQQAPASEMNWQPPDGDDDLPF